MSNKITPEEAKEYEEQRKIDVNEDDLWNAEKIKMYSTLALNLVVIILLVWASLNAGNELSTRFMSLLEIVIGAIFGVTATQIAKE